MKGWSEGHPRIFTVSNLVSNQPLICCSLGGVLVQALIDTGSMKSFITRQIYEQLRPKQEVQPTAQRCYGITGQPLPVHGTVQTTLSFPNNPIVSYPGDFLVSDHLLEPLQCIIGWDFLTSNELQLSFHENSHYFLHGSHGETPLLPTNATHISHNTFSGGDTKKTCLLVQSSSKGPVPVTLSEDLCLSGRTEVLVTGRLPKGYTDQLGMITPTPNIEGNILSAYSVSQANGRCILVRLMNVANYDIELHAGQKVSDFCPLLEAPTSLTDNSSYSLHVSNAPPPSDVQKQLENALSPSLLPMERDILLQTLLKYSDVFDDKVLGHTGVITHKIDTGNAVPIRQLPRRLPYAYRQETSKQITDMLNQGVIQPSHSPWASPIVLVKKKDGSFRFCVDYRKLNAVTRKDAHPLPRVDDLLDSLQGASMFSTLDLRSGYWQISMEPHDREKTAFATRDGLWEFLRMPFGVSNGCATFQRAIEIVLSGLTYETCLCYFDDVIIPSNSLNQQCERLSLILERFRQHNLRVKASKCTFGAPSVQYLGHVVSSKGIHTDPEKIKAVSALSDPKNLEQVRSFLGLSGYYRKFIPNFATLSAPLVSLTKKHSKFHWGENEHNAFITLKSLLCQAPVLAYPQFDKKFILQTDASDLGLGAVLTQYDSFGNERPISYASRPLTPREKDYSATEKEALAAVYAIDHFRVYLLGRDFTLVTDHSALRWLHSVEPKGRIARWVMQLQEYSFDIKHRAGTANGNADALSRLPSNFITTCATSIFMDKSLQEAQRHDPNLNKIMEIKSLGLPKPPFFAWAKDPQLRVFWDEWDDLFLHNGLLVKRLSTETSFPNYAFVLPASLVDSVLHGIHCSPFSGHLGIKRTIHRARERFYWPKMTHQITEFVKNCVTCAQYKLDSQHHQAPLKPIEVNEPFVFWAMDYMGPLPETSRGNKHLLVIMDHFTKWCEVFPTKDQKARTVAEVLVSKVFSRFGPPTVLHSDQGRNFESNVMHEICDLMGVHKSRTTAYHPQCDGLVERQNRTLQGMLAAYVSSHKDDWDLWVDLAVYAYNTSRHESTGFSPYEMVFGRIARTPLKVDLGLPLKDPQTQSEYSEIIRKRLCNIKKVAQGHLVNSRNDQKRRASSNCTWKPFSVGQTVWLRRPKSWKFGMRWVGPYQIISVQGVNYKIRSQQGKDTVVHHNNVKLCTIPFQRGEPFCPVPENGEINVSPGNLGLQGIQREQQNDLPALNRPAYLRQNIRPPLRFGEYITH